MEDLNRWLIGGLLAAMGKSAFDHFKRRRDR